MRLLWPSSRDENTTSCGWHRLLWRGCGQVTLRNLVLVGCEGGQDLALLARRNLDEIKRATKLGRDFVEFIRRDPEVAMRFLETQLGFPRLRGRVGERAACDVAYPQGSHELQAGQSPEALRVPLPEGLILRSLADARVLHHRVAKVVNHRGDGEDAAKPLVQALFAQDLDLQCGFGANAPGAACAQASPPPRAASVRARTQRRKTVW